MNPPHQTHNLWTAFTGVLLLSIMAATANQLQLLSGVRMVMYDVMSPGRLVVAAISEHSQSAVAAEDSRSQSLETKLQDLEQQRRELLIENARLHNRLRQLRDSNGYSNHHAPLAGFDLISARVLSRHGMPRSLRQAMIDAGRAHGLTRSELVLDGQGILLDQGVQNGISDGRPVLAGSVVLGRVDQVGRWVSQLMPVTDKSYSDRVRLVRRSTHGTQMGAEGILEGTGDACRLCGIPDTASVAAGDEVFSADVNGMSGPQLYYGTVVAANFEASAGWSILVRPSILLSDVDHLAVIVPKLNAGRISAGNQESAMRRSP